MNNIKTLIIILTLMTTTAFADFTIKDLFVSGGTQTSAEGKKGSHAKDVDKKKVHEDCI